SHGLEERDQRLRRPLGILAEERVVQALAVAEVLHDEKTFVGRIQLRRRWLSRKLGQELQTFSFCRVTHALHDHRRRCTGWCAANVKAMHVRAAVKSRRAVKRDFAAPRGAQDQFNVGWRSADTEKGEYRVLDLPPGRRPPPRH